MYFRYKSLCDSTLFPEGKACERELEKETRLQRQAGHATVAPD